jgi:hypothetical protein
LIAFAAILTLEIIAEENVFPVQNDSFVGVGYSDKKSQSYNAREGIALGNRADDPSRVVGDRHGFASKE